MYFSITRKFHYLDVYCFSKILIIFCNTELDEQAFHLTFSRTSTRKNNSPLKSNLIFHRRLTGSTINENQKKKGITGRFNGLWTTLDNADRNETQLAMEITEPFEIQSEDAAKFMGRELQPC